MDSSPWGCVAEVVSSSPKLLLTFAGNWFVAKKKKKKKHKQTGETVLSRVEPRLHRFVAGPLSPGYFSLLARSGTVAVTEARARGDVGGNAGLGGKAPQRTSVRNFVGFISDEARSRFHSRKKTRRVTTRRVRLVAEFGAKRNPEPAAVSR